MIKEIIEKLCCKHKWKVHEEMKFYSPYDDPSEDLPRRTRQTLICKECGKITQITL